MQGLSATTSGSFTRLDKRKSYSNVYNGTASLPQNDCDVFLNTPCKFHSAAQGFAKVTAGGPGGICVVSSPPRTSQCGEPAAAIQVDPAEYNVFVLRGGPEYLTSFPHLSRHTPRLALAGHFVRFFATNPRGDVAGVLRLDCRSNSLTADMAVPISERLPLQMGKYMYTLGAYTSAIRCVATLVWKVGYYEPMAGIKEEFRTTVSCFDQCAPMFESIDEARTLVAFLTALLAPGAAASIVRRLLRLAILLGPRHAGPTAPPLDVAALAAVPPRATANLSLQGECESFCESEYRSIIDLLLNALSSPVSPPTEKWTAFLVGLPEHINDTEFPECAADSFLLNNLNEMCTRLQFHHMLGYIGPSRRYDNSISITGSDSSGHSYHSLGPADRNPLTIPGRTAPEVIIDLIHPEQSTVSTELVSIESESTVRLAPPPNSMCDSEVIGALKDVRVSALLRTVVRLANSDQAVAPTAEGMRGVAGLDGRITVAPERGFVARFSFPTQRYECPFTPVDLQGSHQISPSRLHGVEVTEGFLLECIGDSSRRAHYFASPCAGGRTLTYTAVRALGVDCLQSIPTMYSYSLPDLLALLGAEARTFVYDPLELFVRTAARVIPELPFLIRMGMGGPSVHFLLDYPDLTDVISKKHAFFEEAVTEPIRRSYTESAFSPQSAPILTEDRFTASELHNFTTEYLGYIADLFSAILSSPSSHEASAPFAALTQRPAGGLPDIPRMAHFDRVRAEHLVEEITDTVNVILNGEDVQDLCELLCYVSQFDVQVLLLAYSRFEVAVCKNAMGLGNVQGSYWYSWFSRLFSALKVAARRKVDDSHYFTQRFLDNNVTHFLCVWWACYFYAHQPCRNCVFEKQRGLGLNVPVAELLELVLSPRACAIGQSHLWTNGQECGVLLYLAFSTCTLLLKPDLPVHIHDVRVARMAVLNVCCNLSRSSNLNELIDYDAGPVYFSQLLYFVRLACNYCNRMLQEIVEWRPFPSRALTVEMNSRSITTVLKTFCDTWAWFVRDPQDRRLALKLALRVVRRGPREALPIATLLARNLLTLTYDSPDREDLDVITYKTFTYAYRIIICESNEPVPCILEFINFLWDGGEEVVREICGSSEMLRTLFDRNVYFCCVPEASLGGVSELPVPKTSSSSSMLQRVMSSFSRKRSSRASQSSLPRVASTNSREVEYSMESTKSEGSERISVELKRTRLRGFDQWRQSVFARGLNEVLARWEEELSSVDRMERTRLAQVEVISSTNTPGPLSPPTLLDHSKAVIGVCNTLSPANIPANPSPTGVARLPSAACCSPGCPSYQFIKFESGLRRERRPKREERKRQTYQIVPLR